jgi:hypothetical protein
MTNKDSESTAEPQGEGDDSLPELPEEVAQLHPVAFFLAKQLKPGEAGAEFAPIAEEPLLEVAEYLYDLSEKEGGTEELVHAAQTIAAFVTGNKPDSPEMAEQVRELLELPFVVETVKKWSVSADPEKVKLIAERFGNFAGIGSQKKAPKVGEEKPEGAVDLNALNFPKRL